MRYFIELSYNGRAYHGWQKQPNAITVQTVLEDALAILLKEKPATMGAGRTDTGVHATQFFAHFDTEFEIEFEIFKYKLNSILPKDIAIHRIFHVKDDAHTRFDAWSRTYLYRIALEKNPFNSEAAYHFKPQLDIEKLKLATAILFDYKDFQCFSKSNTDVKTYYCDIKHAEWKRVGDELHFTIKADRFLRNMVRAIVGTLITIGTGKIEVSELHAIIKSKNRGDAGFSVPAHGLYLTEIAYPESIRLHDK